MYIHADAGLVYLAHPRTASHATAEALMQVGFSRAAPPSSHHSGIRDIDGMVYGDWTVITTVRNHWDTAISWMVRKPKWPHDLAGLKDTLGPQNVHVRPDRMWWRHSDDADVILRFETLQSDLDNVLGQHGLPSVEIPRVNVTDAREGRDYHEFYSDDMIRYIGTRFADEIAQLGYTF